MSEDNTRSSNGGRAAQPKILPYGRQSIDEDDIAAVVEVLRSDWLTTGPKVDEFEHAIGDFTGAQYAVAVSSGTAALHAAMYAIGIGPGDEVILPPMTFAATANAVIYQGGTPVFVDVQPETLLIDPELIAAKITSRTKAIIAVDYAGQPCDYDELRAIADKHNLILVADACHSLGATYKGRKVGMLADLSCFSFHPVKPITTAEGGMIVTDNEEFARRMRIFRNHGITSDHRQRAERGSWFYEMVDLGYNYRLSDVHSALGISQLRKLPKWLARRQEIAQQYDEAFETLAPIRPLVRRDDRTHAYHLYVVALDQKETASNRQSVFSALREQGIGVNVHYIPVIMHPYYRTHNNTVNGGFTITEVSYGSIVSLPIYPSLTDNEVQNIVHAVHLTLEKLHS